MEFTDTRYNRQELMPQMGPTAQAALASARVCVIGAGGVKSPFLLYLAAAGVGHIRVIEFDRVELSNLNRQVLFDESSIGRKKVEVACERLRGLNSEIFVEAVDARLNAANAGELLGGFDVVVEGGDSLENRLEVNRACLRENVPMVHASAQHNYGYVLTVLPFKTACFECVFPDLPEGHGGSVPVMGIATGIAGTLGAGEVIKLVTGVGRPITDSFLSFSGFQSEFIRFQAPRRPGCPACGAKNLG